jgi:hypothetical protein
MIRGSQEMEMSVRNYSENLRLSEREEDQLIPSRAKSREEAREPEPPVTVIVHNTNKMDFKVERATTPDETWREIKPKLENNLENNTQQLGTKVARATPRYKGRRSA